MLFSFSRESKSARNWLLSRIEFVRKVCVMSRLADCTYFFALPKLAKSEYPSNNKHSATLLFIVLCKHSDFECANSPLLSLIMLCWISESLLGANRDQQLLGAQTYYMLSANLIIRIRRQSQSFDYHSASLCWFCWIGSDCCKGAEAHLQKKFVFFKITFGFVGLINWLPQASTYP